MLREGQTMNTKSEGNKMLEILSKYSEERVVDEADVEMLDILVQSKSVEYVLKKEGIVHAKASQMGKALLSGSSKTS